MASHLRILFAVAGLVALVGTVIADNQKTVAAESALHNEEEEESLGEDADIEEGDNEEGDTEED